MLAVIAAALALAGAPASTKVYCEANMPQDVYGLASPGQGFIELQPNICAGLRKPTGRALLVVLHEARHMTGDMNECRVETYAIRHVLTLIDRFIPFQRRQAAYMAAILLDVGVDLCQR